MVVRSRNTRRRRHLLQGAFRAPDDHTRVKFKLLSRPSEAFMPEPTAGSGRRGISASTSPFLCLERPFLQEPQGTGHPVSRKTSGTPQDWWGKSTGSEVRPSSSKLSSINQPSSNLLGRLLCKVGR